MDCKLVGVKVQKKIFHRYLFLNEVDSHLVIG